MPTEFATFFQKSTALIYLPAHAFPITDEYLDFVEKALEFRRAAQAGPAA